MLQKPKDRLAGQCAPQPGASNIPGDEHVLIEGRNPQSGYFCECCGVRIGGFRRLTDECGRQARTSIASRSTRLDACNGQKEKGILVSLQALTSEAPNVFGRYTDEDPFSITRFSNTSDFLA